MSEDGYQPVRNWTLETDNADIAWLGLRTPGGTNVLSSEVLSELDTVIDALEKVPPAGLIIYSHKESGFIAGADVREFPDLKNPAHAYEQVKRGQAVFNRLAALPFSSVAVFNGIALGGGLELGLACDWRISFSSEQRTLGLPEVQLGVHPGLGGTQRTVRLTGVRAAMLLMLTGKAITPAEALNKGLIDDICEPDEWRSMAAELALLTPPARHAPIIDRLFNIALLRPLIASTLVKQTARKARPEHYPAPFAIINLWQKYGTNESGMDAEARSFAELVFSPTSQNLQRVFFLQDRMKDLAKNSTRTYKHVHVVGAGTMGADIAAWCAIRGLSVTLQDREKQFVDAGLQKAHKTLLRKLKTPERIAAAETLLVGDATGEGARSADVIIEAIFEDLDAKQTLFRQMEQRARPDAVLATNTSSIPLEQIAAALNNPGRLIGLHFFNPVALMPLVEVVHTDSTEQEKIADGLAFVKQIGKLPLPCRSLPGFLVNRILAPYLDEAFRLYNEGIAAEHIDAAATSFGMPVGPLELADNIGLDILLHVAGILSETINRAIPPGLEEKVSKQQLGQKTGAGFYPWKDGKAVKQKLRKLTDNSKIRDRLIMSLVNEAAACLHEKVVPDADLVDAGTIFGAGFAPFLGGPLQYATEVGLEKVQTKLAELKKRHGDRFSASPGWSDLARYSGTKS
jgi:3-hydroxyacyl-CoA dehydrogenase/enoyl-CoA hydratase/3-hydroxybutyryl-CoA epimerase